MRRFLIALPLLLVIPVGVARCGEAQDPAGRAEQFMRRLDAVGNISDPEARKKAGWLEPDAHIQELHEIDAQLREYVTKNPADSRAVVLLVKMYFLGAGLDPFGFLQRSKTTGSTGIEACGLALDRAVRADSLNAELHYWRGQVYAASGSGGTPGSQLQGAIREARRAVALDPKSTRYREGLASLLLDSGDEALARDLYHEVRSDHPMYLLLHDWERIPHIEGLDPFRGLPADMVGSMTGTKAATRMFLFRGTAATFEATCGRVWRGFALTREGAPRAGTPVRGDRLFRWNGDALEMEPDVRKQPVLGTGGMWMAVVQERADERMLPYLGEGMKLGDIYCAVTFLNLRASR